MSFAIGSCSYVNEPEFDRPGKPYGSNFEIFNSINNKNPDFMLWLGDNMYFLTGTQEQDLLIDIHTLELCLNYNHFLRQLITMQLGMTMIMAQITLMEAFG